MKKWSQNSMGLIMLKLQFTAQAIANKCSQHSCEYLYFHTIKYARAIVLLWWGAERIF